MIKTGIVMCILRNKAGIMISSGEFLYIKTTKVLPKIGEIHTGQLCRKNLSLYKYAIVAASLMLIFISSIYTYAYYTTVTTIVLNINPSISLKANRWDKIISSKALNSDGSLLLNNVVIKNKSIDDGLDLLLEKAKIDNFINDKYLTDKKIISVDIKSNKHRNIDVSNFKNSIDSNNLKLKIVVSSDNNKKIEIIANKQKLNTTDLIPNNNNNKEETPNKKRNDKSNTIKKPSVDNNKNILEDKSSEDKKEIKRNTNKTINKKNKIDKDVNTKDRNFNDDDDDDDDNADAESKDNSSVDINSKKTDNESDD